MTKRYFLNSLLALFLSISSFLTLAEPYFIHKDGTMVLDKATGLVWQRCSVGQKWDGTTCLGNASKLSFEEASRVSIDGFQTPQIYELASLIWCRAGTKTAGTEAIQRECADAYATGTRNIAINSTVFLNTGRDIYWSATAKDSFFAWIVGFDGGYVNAGNGHRPNKFAIRLVKSSQSLSADVIAGFDQPSLTANELEAKRLESLRMAETKRSEEALEVARVAEIKQREENRLAEIKRQDENLRQQAARAGTIKKLIAGGAQPLYLQAGKAQRNGSLEIGGVSFNADELYELIIDKFPTSDFAVKAADQLNAMDRTQRQASATRDAANVAASASERASNAMRQADSNSSNRAACFSQVRSCEARCSDNSRPAICIQTCQRTCN